MRTIHLSASILATAVLGICACGLQAQGAGGPGPAGVRIWTGDVAASDNGGSAPAGAPRPMMIVAARNGSFSGKVQVESAGAVKGVRGSVSAISGKGGTIPAGNVQVRYGAAWDTRGPVGPDILLESPPAAVAPVGRNGASCPVWLTVKVPKDAQAGVYTGELAVQAQGAAAVKIPVTLDVQDWTLPDPQDYRTWLDMFQSPDTLAVEYSVPLWSPRHWDLIARSFRLMSDSGARVLYVPLICRTNFGNEQSMVRWIPKGKDKYEADYTVLDQYLDTAEKNLGKPQLVIFVAWDICMSEKSLTRGLWGPDHGGTPTREGREQLLGKGPRVTTFDPATGEANMAFFPRYGEAGSKAIWGPAWGEIRKRMAKRGLEKTMMLGIIADILPSKEDVAFLQDVTGGLGWAFHAHAGSLSDSKPGNKFLHKIADMGYAAHVYSLIFNVNPAKGRQYGWRGRALVAEFPRGGGVSGASCVTMRNMLEFNITGGQRGLGRLGADMWSVVRNAKGQRAGMTWSRYPENNWRNLDIGGWLLAPGPDGAVSTVRLENLREGAQECEARIFIENALLDAAKKAKMGDELAQRAQTLLDDRHRAMWKTVWSNDEDLASVGIAGTGRNPPEGLWQALARAGKKLPGYWDGPARAMRSEEAKKGQEWWLPGWQERDRKLFAMAGEVAAKLGAK